jgi:hypothetical protein
MRTVSQSGIAFRASPPVRDIRHNPESKGPTQEPAASFARFSFGTVFGEYFRTTIGVKASYLPTGTAPL